MRRTTAVAAALLAASLLPVPAAAATTATVADTSDVDRAPTFRPSGTGWATSTPSDLPDEVLLAAADWGAEPGEPGHDSHGRVELRTNVDGTWGQWTQVHAPHELPDPETGEQITSWSEPTAIVGADQVQWRLDGIDPHELTVTYLTADGGEVTRQPDMRTQAAADQDGRTPPAMPDIISRAEWGANESYHNGVINYALQLRFGVVHHTAHSSSANSYSEDQADDLVRSIYRYHTLSRGYNDIAYNFLVDRYGNVYEGRKGGMDRPVVSAATGGFNSGSVSVAVLGNFDQGHLPSAGQQAVQDLLAWKFDVHHVDPHGTTEEVAGSSSNHWPRGTTVELPTIIGHGDTKSTTCPGAHLHDEVRNGTIADTVADTGGPKLYGLTSTTRWRGYATGQDVTTDVTATEEVNWTTTVTSPAGNVISTEKGTGTQFQLAWDLKDDEGNWAPEGRYILRTGATATADGAAVRPFVVPIVIEPSEHSYDRTIGGTVLDDTVDIDLPDSYTTAELQVRWPDGIVRYQDTHDTSGSDTQAAATAFTWPLADQDGTHVDAGTYIAELTVDGETDRIGVIVDEAVQRLSGPDRFATASAVALRHFDPDDTSTIVLASGRKYPDALVAGPLADHLDAPILLTDSDTLPEHTATAIRVLDPARIVVVGGTSTVPDAVVGQATDAAALSAADVTRLAGATRYDTAARVHEYLVANSDVTGTFVASGEDFPDALAASGAAAETDATVLLTPRAEAPDVIVDALDGRDNVQLVGGTVAVTDHVADKLQVDGRIAGQTRYDTALKVAATLPAAGADLELYLASGQSFPDALAASATMGAPGRRLLLTDPETLPGPVAEHIAALDLRQVILVGGPVAIDEGVDADATDATRRGRR